MFLLVLLIAPVESATAHHDEGHAGAAVPAEPKFNPLEALKGLDLGGPDTGSSGGEFLHPDTAFVLSAEVRDDGYVVARWDIAEAYYLYRDKFRFALLDGEGARLGPATLPAGKFKEDPYFGRMEVYYDRVEAVLPVERTATEPIPVTLEVGYQGCADAGLCYPPITKTVALTLPRDRSASLADPRVAQTAPRPEAAGGARPGELPQQDRLARSLATGNTSLVLFAFFGLGLLLTFTPCVLPMIPILSSIIVGQGEGVTTRRAFTLSLTYVLAMAATYTVAGVFAGLSGANLQAAFQNPWILGIFSGVFVLLALAMFGLYDLQVPVGLQAKLVALSNRHQGGTYVGVAAIGFLSALIVGPCVAAPLAGALIYIAGTGDAVLGGAALFALSLGMGAPVLVFGTAAGRLIPKAGPWMQSIKALFGVLLLGVALYLLERIVPGWVALLGWSALFIVAAVFMGAFDAVSPETGGWRRLWKGAGLVLVVYGVLVMIGAASGGDDVLRPLKTLRVAAEGERAPLVFKPVKGLSAVEAELRLARERGRPVMLDFYADWCVSCKELERYTFSDPSVRAVLSDAVLLRSDVTANDEKDQELLAAFGLFGPPAILFFGPDGIERPQFRVVGFMAAEPFRVQAERGLWGGTASGREARAVESRIASDDSEGPRANLGIPVGRANSVGGMDRDRTNPGSRPPGAEDMEMEVSDEHEIEVESNSPVSTRRHASASSGNIGRRSDGARVGATRDRLLPRNVRERVSRKRQARHQGRRDRGGDDGSAPLRAGRSDD